MVEGQGEANVQDGSAETRQLKNAVYANMEKQSSMFERISRANMQFIQVKEDSVATRQREQIRIKLTSPCLTFTMCIPS